MLEWLERNRSNLAAALVVLVAVAAVGLVQLPRRPALQVVAPATSLGPASIKIHVVGAVVSPGVYQLDADARVEDALKAAGGPSESADIRSFNLAAPLRDGQQVAVPSLATQSATSASSLPSPPSPEGGKLDLNAATRQQLEALPGIGPVTAQRILDYRQKNGPFASVEELRDAKLVNAPTYERIKDMVGVR